MRTPNRPVMAIPDLTTAAKVHVRLSTAGVSLRTDHLPHGALADVIEQASCEAAVYLARYPMTASGDCPGAEDSDVVSHWVADLAVYHLCRVRANPVPASVKERYEKVIGMLELVQAGKMVIPDLCNSGDKPAVVNHQIDYGKYPSKRRSTLRSNPKRPTGYPSYTDYNEPPPYPTG